MFLANFVSLYYKYTSTLLLGSDSNGDRNANALEEIYIKLRPPTR